MTRFHISPKVGPARCSAKVRCEFASEEGVEPPHYETLADAQSAFEKELSTIHGSSVTVSSSPKLSALKDALASLPENPTLEEVSALGASFNELVKERLGFDPDELPALGPSDFWTKNGDRYREIGAANAALLSELVPTGGMKNKTAGSRELSETLREAIEVLPTKAIEKITGTFNMRVESKQSRFGGTYTGSAKVRRPTPIKTMCYPGTKNDPWPNDHYPGAKVGEFLYSGMIVGDDAETLTGASLKKVVRLPGDLPISGESAERFVKYWPTEKAVELLKSGVVDSDFVIKEGKAEEFAEKFPELAEKMRPTGAVEEYWAGRKPRASQYNAFSYRKAGEVSEFRDIYGKVSQFKAPLYRYYEEGRDFTQHTITAERGSSKAVLIHEFTHSFQGKSSINTREHEFFEKFTEGSKKKTDRWYEHFDTGPDSYMMNTNGREVFTRATEALFYPDSSPYLYGSEAAKKRSEEVRDWAIGTWLALGR